MHNLPPCVVQFATREDGPTAVEYAVMLALIVLVCVSIVASLGTTVSSSFGRVSSSGGFGS
jgi:pilus assembly protein Flp/PilA